MEDEDLPCLLLVFCESGLVQVWEREGVDDMDDGDENDGDKEYIDEDDEDVPLCEAEFEGCFLHQVLV